MRVYTCITTWTLHLEFSLWIHAWIWPDTIKKIFCFSCSSQTLCLSFKACPSAGLHLMLQKDMDMAGKHSLAVTLVN